MLFLAQSLLRAAGFEYDEIADNWVARAQRRPLATVECEEDGAYFREALRQAQAVLNAAGYVDP
jgi:hypothetical protein